MKFKLKKDVELYSGSDLYYDFFDGGYINPEKFLEDDDQIKYVKDARDLIMNYLNFVDEDRHINDDDDDYEPF